jgi:ribosomal protein L37AE/L43A
MFQDFFSYVDSGALDWAFCGVVGILLVLEVFKWIKRIMNCPVCGAPQSLSVDKYDKNHWHCLQCGWQHANNETETSS